MSSQTLLEKLQLGDEKNLLLQGLPLAIEKQFIKLQIATGKPKKLYDKRESLQKKEAKIEIGKYCWIGAGAKIMPGVILGDWTIVGAGAVVTKSFSTGYCIIGGIPAVEIRDIEKEKWTSHNNKIQDAHEIWFAVMGPDTPVRGELNPIATGSDMQLYQQQFAQTFAKLMGYTYAANHPIADEILYVFKMKK